MNVTKLKVHLESLLKIKGIKQKDAAERLKITPMTLNRFFRTESELRGDALVMLCKLCGVDIEKALEVELGESTKTIAPQDDHPILVLYEIMQTLDDDRRKILVDFIETFLRNSLPEPQVSKIKFAELARKK